MPTVSVIVPVYNVENYLDRCINSLTNQKLKDIEIILVNDGSTDSSGLICDKYKQSDSRIKVIHKKNGGLSDARNIGLEKAIGEYVAFVDSDDFISVNMFQNLIKCAHKNNADICVCKHKKVYEDTIIREDEDIHIVKSFTNIEALKNYLEDYREDKEILTVVWDKIYKRDLFKGIRFPVGKIYEDGYVTYKLLYSAKKIVHMNCIYYYYYQREGSLIRSELSSKTLESYDDWREIFKFLNKRVPLLSSYAATKYIHKHIRTYNQILKNKSSSKEIEVYKEKIRTDLRIDFSTLIKLNLDKELKLDLVLFLLNHRIMNSYKFSKNIISVAKCKLKNTVRKFSIGGLK